jgi:hypothetical protein
MHGSWNIYECGSSRVNSEVVARSAQQFGNLIYRTKFTSNNLETHNQRN